MTSTDDYIQIRRERRSRDRHAAIIAFCTGVIGGAVGSMLIVAVMVWLR